MQGQGPVRPVGLEGEESRMPGGVDLQEVVVPPVRPAGLQQVEAVLRAALHLEGVDKGVLGPDVVGRAVQGLPGRGLGSGIRAQLLKPEGLQAEQVGIGGVGRIPGFQRRGRSAPEPSGVAQEKVQLVGGVQGDGVSGPGLQQGVQSSARA